MGLDCIPVGTALSADLNEWSLLMDRLYAGEELTELEHARRREISIPPWESLKAPVVGRDEEADRWITAALADSPDASADVINQFTGMKILALLKGRSDGVPMYSHGDDFEDVKPVSFRGSFLEFCSDALSNELLQKAWTEWMPPSEAIRYGGELLAAASSARLKALEPRRRRSVLNWLTKRVDDEVMPLKDVLDILETAGRWYTFWGQRGHPIWAYW